MLACIVFFQNETAHELSKVTNSGAPCTMAGEGAARREHGRSPQKRTTLSREQLGIADAVQDVYETADDVESGSEGARGSGHPAEEQQLLRDLETMRKARREDRPAAPAPVDPAPLEPAASRALFQARDAVCLPPQSDFSLEAHARKRDEWLILGKREHRLETPLDRFTRLLAETQALERCQYVHNSFFNAGNVGVGTATVRATR